MKYKICLAVLASILALAASGCSSSQDEGQPNTPQQQQAETKAAPPISAESERFCQEGLAAYGRFEYDAAIAAYDKAIQADGRNYQALSGKGVALAMRGNETGSRQDVADGIASIQKALAPWRIKSTANTTNPYPIFKRYWQLTQTIRGAITA